MEVPQDRSTVCGLEFYQKKQGIFAASEKGYMESDQKAQPGEESVVYTLKILDLRYSKH